MVRALHNLGTVLHMQGNLAEAEQRLRQALELAPDLAEAHSRLGRLLSAQGRLDESIQHFREVTRILPDNPEAQNNLAAALQQAQSAR